MRVFSVEPDGGFTEYEQLPFETDHAETDLEQWLEANPGGILEDGTLLIIGRQVPADLNKSIDLLGVDREGNVVVIELKRGRTPRDVVAQALEYAAFAARLDMDELEGIYRDSREYSQDPLEMDLASRHREYFNQAEAVAFNRDQRIVIVGQQVTPEIRQTALFLGDKGIQVTCVEFTFFQAAGGGRLLSQEIVVGREHKKPRGTTKRQSPFSSEGEFMDACDEHGAVVFARIFDWARDKSLKINLGTAGCSVNVVIVDEDEEKVVPVCNAYSLRSKRYGQSLCTNLGSDHWGIRQTEAPPEVVDQLWKSAEQTELFTQPDGYIDLRCSIDRAFTDAEVETLVAWCESVEQAIREHAVSGGQPSS